MVPRSIRNAPGGVCYHVINRSCVPASIFSTDDDYQYFVHAVQRAQEQAQLKLFSVCLMPNHFHLVVRPRRDGDLPCWMQRLTTLHVRWHHRRFGTRGPLWQGRYKSFPIQEDGHLVTVMRYVERNALRANLVTRAEDWRWGSLNWRVTGGYASLLSPPPVALTDRWVEIVNTAHVPGEVEDVRRCITRGRPFGCEGWVQQTAKELGLSSALHSIGRPLRTPGKGA